MMRDRATSRPRAFAGPGVGVTASFALAAFLAVLAVLIAQLRDAPGSVGSAIAKPRIVIVRRVYETIVHERVIGAAAATTPAPPTTVSTSSVPASPPAAPVATRSS